uniref:Putative secreted protein n=1 Tax=Anopheles darlingi TaxID=43151 RepID=A0A2M4D9Z1_ANODA
MVAVADLMAVAVSLLLTLNQQNSSMTPAPTICSDIADHLCGGSSVATSVGSLWVESSVSRFPRVALPKGHHCAAVCGVAEANGTGSVLPHRAVADCF